MTEAEMLERIHALGMILSLTDDECAKVLEELTGHED